MYTKLKYSRSPQYDIVSGGVAALLAGFFGFLAGEKFGLELLDSGDFYIALMYVVFLGLFGRLIFKIIDDKTTLSEIVTFM
jgi:H+/Cl- antiporter ClcA